MYIVIRIHDFLENKAVRFLIAGGVGSMIYFLVFSGLIEIYNVDYKVSVFIGWAISTFVGFFIQKYLVFNNEQTEKIWVQGILFFVKSFIIFITNYPSLTYIVETYSIHPIIAQIIVVPFITFLSYVVSKIIFRNKKPDK